MERVGLQPTELNAALGPEHRPQLRLLGRVGQGPQGLAHRKVSSLERNPPQSSRLPQRRYHDHVAGFQCKNGQELPQPLLPRIAQRQLRGHRGHAGIWVRSTRIRNLLQPDELPADQ